jgi:hypothetical protein
MPELGQIDPSVRFLVRVAAVAFILESVTAISLPPYSNSVLLYLTRNTWFHVTHHVIEFFLLNARGAKVRTSSADGLLRLGIGASESARRTNIDATSTQPAGIRFDVKGSANGAILTSAPEPNRLGNHLLLAHPHAQSAKDAVLVLLMESLLVNTVFRSEILQHLRLRT